MPRWEHYDISEATRDYGPRVLEMEFEVAKMALARGDQDAAEHALCLIDSFYLLHLNPDTAQGELTIH